MKKSREAFRSHVHIWKEGRLRGALGRHSRRQSKTGVKARRTPKQGGHQSKSQLESQNKMGVKFRIRFRPTRWDDSCQLEVKDVSEIRANQRKSN
uniref:Uncharacterized protein n=1 Tax=Romanomermis culicivorax TaxID=13658 RepID=A0A915JJH9_ROMCU